MYRKICRVCGAEYEGCHSINPKDGVFHWREVACSPECGAQYLAEINMSRAPIAQEGPAVDAVESDDAEEIFVDFDADTQEQELL